MAAAVACRKRAATPFLDEVFPAPPHLAKRGRFSPCPAGAAPAQRPPLAFDPLDALRRVFPDAGPGELEACLAASGRDVHPAVEACRARRRRHGGVRGRPGGTDVRGGRRQGLASLVLKLVEGAVANCAAAAEAAPRENAALRARAEELERDNGVLRRGVAAQHRRQEELERDNGVLKRGVATLHRRQEETERAAEELKVAELEAANYALSVQARAAASCRFRVFRGPDVF